MIYQLVQFDRSVNDFMVIAKDADFVGIVEQAIVNINKEVDNQNSVYASMDKKLGNLIESPKMDYVEYDQMYEIFENGQNWVINNKVFGIIGFEDASRYKDVVLVICGVELNEDDIKAIKIPFENKDFFKGYMTRVVEVFGGKYDVYSLDEFDKIINDDKLDIGFKERPYVIHTKIVK